PHSVEAWGYRLGHNKAEHEEWDRLSPEMLRRREEDVEIQVKIYNAVLEAGKGEGWTNAHRLNHKLVHYLQLQEEYRWTVDRPHMDHCLDTLNRWIDRIDRAVSSHLPIVTDVNEIKKEGEYGWVKRPFKKDGTYSEAARRYMDDCGLEL